MPHEPLRTLDAQRADFPRLHVRAAAFYAAYVAGLGPLGAALPPFHALIDRQQYAWRCVVRVAEEETPCPCGG